MTAAPAGLADLVVALRLAAACPAALGGVLLRGAAGPLREAALALAAAVAGGPLRKLPAAADDETLQGGLDLAATLAAGRPVARPGLLSEAAGGVLVTPMAERLPPRLAFHLAGALDAGRLTVIALDEAQAGEAGPPAVLAERLALIVELGTQRPTGPLPVLERDDVERLGRAARSVWLAPEQLEALAEASLCLGIASLRAPLQAVAAARAAAALSGRTVVDDDDMLLATRLVLAPRATILPAADDAAGDSEADGVDGPSGEPDRDETESAPRDLTERIVAAARACLPDGVLDGRASRRPDRGPLRSTGRFGPAVASTRLGRPVGARAGTPDGRARLALVDTLRAAAPWQRLRRAALDGPRGAAVLVRRADFRVAQRLARRPTTTIFIVDTSGSAALHRLGEAKGAVESLLGRCYVRRDAVAMIGFGGRGVAMLLPPTRSLARAKRSLAGLAGGGGTPLAAAIDAAAGLARTIRRDGHVPMLVFLTDGRANIARGGLADRARARADVDSAAEAMRCLALDCVVIDTTPRPSDASRHLAETMAARYLPLPASDGARIARVLAPM